MDEATLERLAAEELLKEASRAKIRADVGGPTEWKKKPQKSKKLKSIGTI